MPMPRYPRPVHTQVLDPIAPSTFGTDVDALGKRVRAVMAHEVLVALMMAAHD